jgi:hypothetical protein
MLNLLYKKEEFEKAYIITTLTTKKKCRKISMYLL